MQRTYAATTSTVGVRSAPGLCTITADMSADQAMPATHAVQVSVYTMIVKLTSTNSSTSSLRAGGYAPDL